MGSLKENVRTSRVVVQLDDFDSLEQGRRWHELAVECGGPGSSN